MCFWAWWKIFSPSFFILITEIARFLGRKRSVAELCVELIQSALKFAAVTIDSYCRCRIDVPVLETLHLLGLLLAVGEAQSSFIVN